MTKRVVLYINQFFAGLGGEETAHVAPSVNSEIIGPGTAFRAVFGQDAEIVGTVVCGDNHYTENLDEARAVCLDLVRSLAPDCLVAGPAFNAGRYGVACGDICKAVSQELGIPAVTGWYPENPGKELYGNDVFAVATADSARGMKDAVSTMGRLALRLMSGEPMGPARVESYLHRGMRRNFFHEMTGAQRAVEMGLLKFHGKKFQTELEMPVFKKIPPAAPVKDLKTAKIALCSSGGIVPKGNPDRIRVSSAMSWGRYDISGIDDLTPDNYESIHGGYDRTWALEDPDRVLPLDEMRKLEKEGVFGKLYDYVSLTTGTATSVANAERFGREIGEILKRDGVDAAILTST
jgi:glycine reductase